LFENSFKHGTIRYLQESDTKHEEDMHLLSARQAKFGQQRHRQKERNKVRKDVDDGIHPSLHVNIVAGALERPIPSCPGAFNWPTLEYRYNDEGNTECNIEGYHKVNNPSKGLVGKYPQIEE
jgi:hypothetical protein